MTITASATLPSSGVLALRAYFCKARTPNILIRVNTQDKGLQVAPRPLQESAPSDLDG